MRGRRLLGGVLAGLVLAAVGLVGVILAAPHIGGGVPTGTTQLVAVTRDLNAGDLVQNGDWTAVNVGLPASTLGHYFSTSQTPLFVGKALVSPLHTGDLLPRDDIQPAATASSSIVPIKFKVSPDSLTSGDSLCIYAIDGPGILRIFYLTPLVVTSTGKGWQVTVPPIKAPYFLYAAVNMDLASFGSTSSGQCPATPIFSSTQAIEGATGTTGLGK
jgi:hypothetical protein